MTSQPYILLLSLQKLDGFDGMNSDLLSALRTVADLKQASTFSQAKRRLTQAPIPKAVIVTDEAVTEPSYSQILLKLVRYCNAGGNVVFACQFSSLAQGPKITDMFHKSFDLPWTPGSYTRSEFVLNKTVKGLDTGNLAPGYLVKALHLAHVPRDAAVYLPCVSGQTESSREAPAAFTDVGRGHVSYVGDVNTEGASIDLIIAMCLASRDLTETSHSSSARPLCQKPTILMLSFEKEEWLEDTYSQLYAGLRKNAIVHEALTDQDANRHLSAPLPPYAVLVTDATISKPRYSSLVSLLVGFVRKGGRLVFGCHFSNHLQMNMVAPFFPRWGLPWHAGSYYRTTFALNPAGIPAPLSRSALFPTYSMKALHLKHVRRAVAVYLPTSGSRVESHVFEPTPISGPQLEESPAVFEPVGSGYVGYVGDVNGE
ncbi:hypothetical protein AcV7_005674 [Taiwanofungus camphoratus]|nr:hypothetical protein AcV7_005674 [Antrodia cinnamomea]